MELKYTGADVRHAGAIKVNFKTRILLNLLNLEQLLPQRRLWLCCEFLTQFVRCLVLRTDSSKGRQGGSGPLVCDWPPFDFHLSFIH